MSAALNKYVPYTHTPGEPSLRQSPIAVRPSDRSRSQVCRERSAICILLLSVLSKKAVHFWQNPLEDLLVDPAHLGVTL
eukprot:COSAG02_NODE_17956_length_969_cov_0.826437_2_plen_78_part_01